jgi:hypothetical protein
MVISPDSWKAAADASRRAVTELLRKGMLDEAERALYRAEVYDQRAKEGTANAQ